MAIYRFHLKHGSRAGGKSAYGHVLYLLREHQYEYRVHELRHIEHGNMPEWAKENPREFWQAADAYERQNARLYTEFEVSLPRELSKEQQFWLVQEFVHHTLGDRHPYTLIIHESLALDGKPHPHFHLMFSARTLDGIEREHDVFFSRANTQEPQRGGAQKDLSWYAQERLADLRLAWERQANLALKRAGIDVQIDRRTLEAQGITRQPEPVLGPYHSMLLKQGVITERASYVLELREQRRLAEELAKYRAEQEEAKRDIHAYNRLREEYQALVTATETLSVEQIRCENTIDSLETYIRHHAPHSPTHAVEMAAENLWGHGKGVHEERIQRAHVQLEQFEQTHQRWWHGLDPRVLWERHELRAAVREAEQKYQAFLEQCMSRQSERDALAERLWQTGIQAQERLEQYRAALERTDSALQSLEHRVEETFSRLTHAVEQLYDRGIMLDQALHPITMGYAFSVGQEEVPGDGRQQQQMGWNYEQST